MKALGSAEQDSELTEMGLWGEISTQLDMEIARGADLYATQRSVIALAELEVQSLYARATIVRGAMLEYHALLATFLGGRVFHDQCDAAVSELLAWKDILDRHPLPHKETSVIEKEAAFATSMNAPTAQQLDLERRRAEESKREADQQLALVVEQLSALKKERRQLEEQVRELTVDRQSLEQSVHTLRVEKLDERHRVEGELKALREQVRSERELLETLKAANEAAVAANTTSPGLGSRKQSSSIAAAEPIAAKSTSAPLSSVPAIDPLPSPRIRLERADSAHPIASGPQSPYAGSPSPTREFTPSISSGLKALQSVREQLKDIREAHSQQPSMYRAHSGVVNGGSTAQPDVTAGVPRTSSSLSALPHVHSSNDMGSATRSLGSTAASPGGSAPEEAAATPWKQRLSKLQSDLKLLKAELGTTL